MSSFVFILRLSCAIFEFVFQREKVTLFVNRLAVLVGFRIFQGDWPVADGTEWQVQNGLPEFDGRHRDALRQTLSPGFRHEFPPTGLCFVFGTTESWRNRGLR